ncbi:MAG: flavodoxin family protein [Anaerolineae bacterium]
MRSVQVLGVSGSPVKNSNTDRIVKAILEASGLEYEFVKLSTRKIGPCRACKQCTDDNVCKTRDDFPALAEKVKEAKALVIAGYTPYGMLDGFTKAFLERLWSTRHVNNLNRGKLAATVVTGITPLSVNLTSLQMARELYIERMEVLGQIKVRGNVPCLTCGHGNECQMSGVPALFGKGATASVDKCIYVEDQEKVWNQALRLGQLVGERVRGNAPARRKRPPLPLSLLLLADQLRVRRWTASA